MKTWLLVLVALGLMLAGMWLGRDAGTVGASRVVWTVGLLLLVVLVLRLLWLGVRRVFR
jgi:hypothetical protein